MSAAVSVVACADLAEAVAGVVVGVLLALGVVLDALGQTPAQMVAHVVGGLGQQLDSPVGHRVDHPRDAVLAPRAVVVPLGQLQLALGTALDATADRGEIRGGPVVLAVIHAQVLHQTAEAPPPPAEARCIDCLPD